MTILLAVGAGKNNTSHLFLGVNENTSWDYCLACQPPRDARCGQHRTQSAEQSVRSMCNNSKMLPKKSENYLGTEHRTSVKLKWVGLKLTLNWCGSPPLGTLGDVWGHFWFSQLGREVLLAPGGWRPGLLLSTLQCTGHPTPEKDPPAPRCWRRGSMAFVPLCFCEV